MTVNSFLRTAGLVVTLVAFWVLAWGDLSLVNVVSGFLVAALVLATFPIGPVTRDGHVVHLGPAVRLLGLFVWNLLASNLSMARDILAGPSGVRTGIVACPLRVDSDGVATFLANVLSLSPGTLAIEITHGPPVLYLHVLHVDRREQVLELVRRFEELAVRTAGTREEQAACGVLDEGVPR